MDDLGELPCAGRSAIAPAQNGTFKNLPRAFPAVPDARGFFSFCLQKLLGLRLSNFCCMLQNLVFNTIFKKGGASGLACEWARVPKAPKKH